MNKLNFQIRNTKFALAVSKARKTKAYKIIVGAIILFVFIIAFLTMLFINPNKPSTTILNNPQLVIQLNLLPMLVGLVSGIALASAGCAMQGITRNSLAGPTTLGFMPIATMGLFVVKAIGLEKQTYMLYIFAFGFSLIGLFINYIGIRNSFKSGANFKIILVGLIFGALITSLNAILVAYLPQINESVQLWLGSTSITYNLGNFRWEKFIYSAPLILVAFLVVMSCSKKLNIIESDVNLAITLGININRLYWILGIASVVLTIAAINLVGSVVIIGIVMPHLVRYLLNTRDYHQVTFYSSIMTGMVLMIAMYINTTYNLGLNLYAVLISAPIFLYLIFFRGK